MDKNTKLPVPKFNPEAWLIPSSSTYKTPLRWHISSRVVLAAVGVVSKLWIQILNSGKFYNRDTLTKAIESRPEDRGLVTICNHDSCVDDPLMWGLKMRYLMWSSRMRWTATAEDVCYNKPLHAFFFNMCQGVPVRRGGGVYQKSMDFLLHKLNMGQWVHFFPEGKINVTEDKLIRFKWGVGRLIADCQIPPIVLPIVHIGMDSILPNKRPYIPQLRQNVTLLVGDPMDFSKEIAVLKSSHKSPRDIRKHITDRLQEELGLLKEKAMEIHSELNR